MARKRDDRTRHQHYQQPNSNHDSYFQDDHTFPSFANQLARLGLQLRDIPGDGNCLFRALGDQLEGHPRNHHRHRLETVKYMQEHRADFEPFVEDDITFDKHILNLKRLGTYAGNDVIVAFARNHDLNVTIHQLDSPLWTINGSHKPHAQTLHISFHNGDHYSSVRRLGDNTESPANIELKTNGIQYPTGKGKNFSNLNNSAEVQYSEEGSTMNMDGYDSDYDNVPPNDHHRKAPPLTSRNMNNFEPTLSGTMGRMESEGRVNGTARVDGMARAVRNEDDIIGQVMTECGCNDYEYVKDVLHANFYDTQLATECIKREMGDRYLHNGSAHQNGYRTVVNWSSDAGLWSANGTGTRIHGNHDEIDNVVNDVKEQGVKPKNKITSREKKDKKKAEKKQKATERHKLKFGKKQSSASNSNYDYEEERSYNGIVSNMGTLQI